MFWSNVAVSVRAAFFVDALLQTSWFNQLPHYVKVGFIKGEYLSILYLLCMPIFHWHHTFSCRLFLQNIVIHFWIHLCTAWKVTQYGVFSGPYFPAFGLNTERYRVSLRIQFEWGKIRTRNNSVFGHFSRSAEYTSDHITCIQVHATTRKAL